MSKHQSVVLAALFLLLGLADASAQTFFTTKQPGTVQARFTANVAGVTLAVDGQFAGAIPLSIWVKPGTHQFTFTEPGEEPKTIPYPVRGDVDVPYVSTAKKFPLTVTTNVPGASLAVDGAPFANRGTITKGPHTLTVSAPGYNTLSIPFEQPASANTLNVTLVSSLFPLTVTTNVRNATLALDGQPFAGRSTNASAGAHTLTVSAPGYNTLTIPFTQPSSANTLNVTLIASTFPLTVNTNVPNATLAIDGQPFAGRSTNASAGAHTLTVSAPGYNTLTIPFTQPSSANTLNVTLIASTFPLTVNTNVPNATLAIDGQPFVGKATNATAGAHTLTVSAPGYDTLTIPFTQPSTPNTLNVTLIASTFPLTVTTNVPGAVTAIDGVPFSGSTAATPGAHTLTVSAPNYQTLTIPFQQPNKANTLNVTLIATPATVTVNTEGLFRAGTAYKVFVNNVENRGTVLSLSPGSYLIRIVSDQISIETSVAVSSGQALTLAPSLVWNLR